MWTLRRKRVPQKRMQVLHQFPCSFGYKKIQLKYHNTNYPCDKNPDPRGIQENQGRQVWINCGMQ